MTASRTPIADSHPHCALDRANMTTARTRGRHERAARGSRHEPAGNRRSIRGKISIVTVTEFNLTAPPQKQRSASDLFMRSLLRIPDRRPTRRQREVHGIFSLSIVLSGLRCLVSYLLLPLIAPIFGAAAGAGPALGVPISVVALIFDVFGVRRFWIADHPRRWAMTAVYAAVMVMVTTFLIVDCVRLAR
jgi:hypothetical protein